MAWASQTATAVIPRGAGSGVCGGAQAQARSVVLDLSRMNRVTDIDLVSQTITVQAGLHGDRLEQALAEHQLTAGLYPQSIAISTVGGWIAASSAGQASTGFGAIEDVLLGLTAVLPQGEILRCPPVPRSAAGPDLRRLLIGSEGTLAVVTEATLACRALPAGWDWLAFAFAGIRRPGRRAQGRGAGADRGRGHPRVRRDRRPAELRGAGPSRRVRGAARLPGRPCRGWTPGSTRPPRRSGAPGLRVSSAPGYGEHWWQHRNDAVQTYAGIMGPERAFGPGVIVDTFEVAGLWSAVPRLYHDIRAALATRAQAVGCHLSHLYPSGSSLYFTFLIGGADDRDAETQYLAAWDEAVRSCAAAGGTITHHHGVGRLKAGYLAADLGETGVAVLRRIKGALDPAWIMNPRVLLP